MSEVPLEDSFVRTRGLIYLLEASFLRAGLKPLDVGDKAQPPKVPKP